MLGTNFNDKAIFHLLSPHACTYQMGCSSFFCLPANLKSTKRLLCVLTSRQHVAWTTPFFCVMMAECCPVVGVQMDRLVSLWQAHALSNFSAFVRQSVSTRQVCDIQATLSAIQVYWSAIQANLSVILAYHRAICFRHFAL